MNKKIISIGFIMVFLSLILSGCNGERRTIDLDTKKFVGTWKASEKSHNTQEPGTLHYNWTFSDNGTVHIVMTVENDTGSNTFTNQWLEFKVISNDSLQIKSPIENWLEYKYSFSSNFEELTLVRDSVDLLFLKQ